MKTLIGAALVCMATLFFHAESWAADETTAQWQTNCQQFVKEFDAAVKAAPEGSYSDIYNQNYAKKHIRWRMKFQAVREYYGEMVLDFDGEPFGMRRKLFDSEYNVTLYIIPLPAALADWKKMTKGTTVIFEGTVKTTTWFKLGTKRWGQAAIEDVKPIAETKP